MSYDEPPPRRGPRPKQSRLSIALEALGGGLVIALLVGAFLGWWR